MKAVLLRKQKKMQNLTKYILLKGADCFQSCFQCYAIDKDGLSNQNKRILL